MQVFTLNKRSNLRIRIRLILQMMGSRKTWSTMFVLTSISVIVGIQFGMPPLITPVLLLVLAFCSYRRVYDFGGNSRTFLWLLIPPVFALSAMLLEKPVVDYHDSANTIILKWVKRLCFISIFIIGASYAASHYFFKEEITKVQGTNPETIKLPSHAECYKKGLEYFSSIGIMILTTYPDEGRFATEVAKERCHNSPLAFGR